jgi:hypothetical protein
LQGLGVFIPPVFASWEPDRKRSGEDFGGTTGGVC